MEHSNYQGEEKKKKGTREEGGGGGREGRRKNRLNQDDWYFQFSVKIPKS